MNQPRTRPPATLSPIGGEGRGEGAGSWVGGTSNIWTRIGAVNGGRRVAPTGSRLFRRLAIGERGDGSERPAGWQPATQQIANLRHKPTGSWKAFTVLRPRIVAMNRRSGVSAERRSSWRQPASGSAETPLRGDGSW